MTEKNDLWGDLDLSSHGSEPLELLRHQTGLLEEKSGGIIKGEIDTTTEDGIFYHTFFLLVPTLSNYRYALFKIATGIKPYPIFIYDNSHEKGAIKAQSKKKVPRRTLIGDPFMENLLSNKMYEALKYEYIGTEIPDPDHKITSYSELESAIESILKSTGTKSIISSILNKIEK